MSKVAGLRLGPCRLAGLAVAAVGAVPGAFYASLWKLVDAKPAPALRGRLHRIPVTYDGPDLEATASALELTTGEVVRRHTEPTYRCFMIGLAPGWAYLGPLPEALRLPCRRVPRTHVRPARWRWAGQQTGIYTLPTPGGWHLIGWMSVRMFLAQSAPPSLLRTGNWVGRRGHRPPSHRQAVPA